MVETPIYYQSGKRKGELKDTRREWLDIEPNKARFIKVVVEKEFDFIITEQGSYRDYNISVSLYACPECKTIKMVGYDD
jgi:hypothetical protein